MGARGGDWSLVGRGSDPVPGDPDEVWDEAVHYSSIASTIEQQAARLRRLAESETGLKGAYADELRESMTDLAGDLDKIHGRFSTAGSQLKVLHPALEDARRDTKKALDAAVEEKNAASEEDAETDPLGPFEKSPHEKAVDAAMSTFDTVADEVARKIRNAADDDMKDSRWDKFKGFVGSIATALTFIRNIIGVVLVVLAVVALFVPGLNAIVIGLMLASLAISTLLAVTDNGSWVDVAWDVAGLLTFGIGSGALKLARTARGVGLGRSAGRAASQQAFARTAWNGGAGFRGLVSRFRPSVISAQVSAYDDAFRAAFNTPIDDLGRWGPNALKDMVRSGFNRDVASLTRDLANLGRTAPGVNAAAVSFGTNFSITGVAGTLSGVGLYQEVKSW